ncbi:hypothetical protein JCM11491_006747 [Sporobolomyces phaffii]
MERRPGSISTVALWLVADPSSATSKNLAHTIDALAERYSTPRFSPHVTLLTRVPYSSPATVVPAVSAVLAEWKRSRPTDDPLVLSLGSGLGSKADQQNYFQYLFARVDLSHALAGLRTAVREGLIDPDARTAHPDDYFPHLSLMYGTDASAENRIARDIIDRLETGHELDPAGRAEDALVVERGQFVASEVWCVKCEGPVESWQVLGKINL